MRSEAQGKRLLSKVMQSIMHWEGENESQLTSLATIKGRAECLTEATEAKTQMPALISDEQTSSHVGPGTVLKGHWQTGRVSWFELKEAENFQLTNFISLS